MKKTSAKLISFAALIVVIALGAAALGRATDATPPFGEATAISDHGSAASDHDSGMAGHESAMSGHGSATGLALRPEGRRLAAGQAVAWRFRIVDAHGETVRRFEREQTKLLHLILVRSDLSGYQHLHPTLGADGTFSIPIEVERPGRYRAIADFTSGGERHVLDTDLRAPGRAVETPLPAPSTVARTDGYTVRLQRPAALRAGDSAPLSFEVSRAGRPVRDLQPYLGAYGHLVALHVPDLDYSHIHPVGEDLAKGSVSFEAELPEPGSYRLFVQFRAGGRVHTAAFTQRVAPAAHPSETGESHGH
jgi:hypothetical protein